MSEPILNFFRELNGAKEREHNTYRTYQAELGINDDMLRDKSVLDLGSGLADFAEAMRKKGTTVISVDAHPEWHGEGIKPHTSSPFVIGDGRELPFLNESFDLIVARAAVHSVVEVEEDLVAVLKESYRVLKPGGEFRFGPGSPISFIALRKSEKIRWDEIAKKSDRGEMTGEEHQEYLKIRRRFEERQHHLAPLFAALEGAQDDSDKRAEIIREYTVQQLHSIYPNIEICDSAAGKGPNLNYYIRLWKPGVDEAQASAPSAPKLSYSDEIALGPRRLTGEDQGYDFVDYWNEMPSNMTDRERLEAFVKEHEPIAMPDFSNLYDVDLPEDLEVALRVNFIKRNYIVGGICRMLAFSGHTGAEISPEVRIEQFKNDYPQLSLPDGLSPEQSVEYIQRNYINDSDYSIAALQFGIQDKKLLQKLQPARAMKSPARLIKPDGATEDVLDRVDANIYTFTGKIREIPHERKIQAWEKNLLGMVEVATNELLKSYGLPTKIVPMEQIHIVTELDAGGEFYPMDADITILEAENESIFVERATHEMLHFKAGTHYRYFEELGGWATACVGIHTRSKRDLSQTLAILNESVTEELTIRAIKNTFSEHHEYFASNADRYIKTGWLESATLTEHAYLEECWALDRIIDKLFQLNRDKFESRAEVFAVFAKATLTGQKLELGRLVERTFGKGSFKRLGAAADSDTFKEVSRTLGSEIIEVRLQELARQKLEMLNIIIHEPTPESQQEYDKLDREYEDFLDIIERDPDEMRG